MSEPKTKRTTSRSATRTPAGPTAPAPGLKARLGALPPWLSALAAITGATLTALGVFGLIGHPAPSATAATPRVTLDSVVVSASAITGNGTFSDLDPNVQEIVFVGRQAANAQGNWLAVDASMAPTVQSGTLQTGDWEAARPSPPAEPFRWFAVVWPKAAGATGSDDLRLNGPDSDFVVAKSGGFDTP